MKGGNNHLTLSVKKAGLIAALQAHELGKKHNRPDLINNAQQIVKAVKTGDVKKVMDSVLEAGE